MIEDIKQVIQKNLPEQVSKELKQRLEDGETAIARVKMLEESTGKLMETVKELEKFDRDKMQLASGQASLEHERQKFEIEKRDWKIKEMEGKYNDVKSLMHDVFRNQRIVYRRDSWEDRQVLENGYTQTLSDHHRVETEKVED